MNTNKKELNPKFSEINNQKAHNDDIDFSGIFLNQYPEEEAWYKDLQGKLSKYKKKDEVNKIINFKKDIMHPSDFEYITNNFIALYNQYEKPVMKLIRGGLQEKNIINKVFTEYKANFFVEFPNRKSYYGYEIMVHLQRDVRSKEKFKFENTIVDVKLKGGIGLSDVSYGVPNDIQNESNNRFYKDTNQYGEYLFMYNDNEVKQILQDRSGQVDESIKGVAVGTGRNIISNRHQRGKTPVQPKYVANKIYTEPSKSKGKVKIGGKCIEIDPFFNKLIPGDCENGIEFEYSKNKLKHKNQCLSYHADGNVELLGCDNLDSCKPNESLTNCMNFKFIKYGGLEIDGNNSCLNINKKSFIAEPCDMSSKADIE